MLENEEEIPVKCVIVGDGAVGKTCLLISYAKDSFLTKYIPTVYENYAADVLVGGNLYSLSLHDTSGQETYDRIRPIVYPNTDVFLLCFSVVTPSSLANVSEKWLPEIKHHCPNCPIVLVGTQTDLRYDIEHLQKLAIEKENPISFERGEKIASNIGAVKYVECSALTREGVRNVFDQAVIATIIKPTVQIKKKKCTFL